MAGGGGAPFRDISNSDAAPTPSAIPAFRPLKPSTAGGLAHTVLVLARHGKALNL